jgi:hypothetical protein
MTFLSVYQTQSSPRTYGEVLMGSSVTHSPAGRGKRHVADEEEQDEDRPMLVVTGWWGCVV